jgi:hypothetical protein
MLGISPDSHNGSARLGRKVYEWDGARIVKFEENIFIPNTAQAHLCSKFIKHENLVLQFTI